MSKKQINSRLEKLFSSLETTESAQPVTGSRVGEAESVSWSWECDVKLNYTACGGEVQDALGISPSRFLHQSLTSFGLTHHTIQSLKTLLDGGIFPAEMEAEFVNHRGKQVVVRMSIFKKSDAHGGELLHGFCQVLPNATPRRGTAPLPTLPATPPVEMPKPKNGGSLHTAPRVKPVVPSSQVTSPTEGVALTPEGLQKPSGIWSDAAHRVEALNQPVFDPAAIAMPLKMGQYGDGLLELVDDTGVRRWSEEDRQLVTEVANQLVLALENAQLYAAVQQELGERVRAEQEILRRNKDLSTLNQIGQQLSKLTNREEIITLITGAFHQLVDDRNLTIALYNESQQTLTFAANQLNGVPQNRAPRPLANEILDYLIKEKAPLLINGNVASTLAQKGIDLPARMPRSVLGLPLLAGDRPTGAILFQNYESDTAFNQIHLELLSTTAAQMTTSLENANLFQEIRGALSSLENRERYQANVARSVATLTETGIKALPNVLGFLGNATQAIRVYYAQIQEDERGLYWRAAAEWVSQDNTTPFDRNKIHHMPVAMFPHWATALREKGWVAGLAAGMELPEGDFLQSQHIRSALLLAVPGKNSTPSFLAFEVTDSDRIWQTEEINVLRVAADGISNTIVREDLLDQLQASLDETENLYNASHRLALASDLQDMVAAIVVGMRSPGINRAVLVLFDYDTLNKMTAMKVAANWYSGRGTPPPSMGTEYLRSTYERLFTTSSPVFFDDIHEAQIDPYLHDIFVQQSILSLAILPLWSGKRQLGVLMLQSEEKHRFTGKEIRSYPPLVDQMAISAENTRLFEQTQAALSETEQLYKINAGIATANDSQELITLVAREIRPANADFVTLQLVTAYGEGGEPKELEVVGSYDSHGEYHNLGVHLSIPEELPVMRTLTNEPLVFNDIRRSNLDPVSIKTILNLGVTAGFVVPLRSGGRLIGALVISSVRPAEFSQDDARLFQTAGNGITVALERQRLLRDTQRRALELQTAAEIARDITSTLEVDTLLANNADLLRERFQFDHVSIFLLDDSGSFAIVREATGEAGQEMKKRGHKLAVGSRSVIGSVTSSGRPLIINDVTQNPIHVANPLLPNTRSEMALPLRLGDRILGALDLQSNRVNAFTQDDLTVLSILADQIAIAIDNARAYELSRQAYEDMKEVDRVKSQFLANMSHELRTPLNSIIGFSRVILKGIDGPINDIQNQDLSAIYNSGQHLLNLINDILDLSKIEAGKMELQFSEVNVADMVNSAMSTAVGLVKDKPIKLVHIVPPDLPTVMADSTRVRQVLINFLSNAAKFTEEGSITVEASRIISPEGKPEIMLAVTDTGDGIAEADRGKLFQRFSQVDDSPTRKTGGTGLGLNICRNLIEMHNGRIGLLRSEVGKGSTFFFTLPLPQPRAEEVFAEIPESEQKVVLAIDDDPKVISLYQRYLKPQGYNVVALTDPKQAVERVKEVKPFAITLDIMMPEKDGWSVIRDLKANPETRDIPVIICSILEEAEKGVSLGAADYLVKPFLQDELLNAVHRIDLENKFHNVLIIDDDPEDQRLVQKMLEEIGRYEIRLANGGVQGWQMLHEQKPDIVILDLFMPDRDGFSLLADIRADSNLIDLPVIILTGADLTPEQYQKLTEFNQQLLGKGMLKETDLLNTLETALQRLH